MNPLLCMGSLYALDISLDITIDFNARRSQIEGLEIDLIGVQLVSVQVPLSEMVGYATRVRSMTQGRASTTMEPSHYEEVPRNISEEIMARSEGKAMAR